MPVTNDFQTFATGSGANVLTPANWAATTARFTGFQSGVASSAQANTALRQANFVTAMIAQFIADTLAQSVADNGNLATLEAQFINAIQTSVGSPVQAAFWHFGHDTGPVNVMQVAASPIITAYADGMTLSTFPQFSNTVTNPTLSANGLASIVIAHADGTALQVGDIAANTAIVFEYDAGINKWRIISQAAVPQSALSHYGADVGTANAMSVATLTPGIAAVTTGMQFIIKKGAAANTGPTTLFIAGTSAALTWGDGTAFSGGEWPANADGFVVYDGNYRLIGVASPFAFIIPGVPPPLLAPRTYYVDAAAGNDTNDGLAAGAGHAFATITKAITSTQSMNMNGFNVTINVANGTYAPFTCGPLNGSGNVFLVGNHTTPSSCLIHATTGEAIIVSAPGYNLDGFAVQADANGSAPHVGAGIRANALVYCQNISFGVCSQSHMWLDRSGVLVYHGVGDGFSSSFVNITGNALYHIQCNGGDVENGQPILNITGARTVTAFWYASSGGLVDGPYSAINFISGATVTGSRYNVTSNAVLNTAGAGASYLPGSSAGTASTGGQYL